MAVKVGVVKEEVDDPFLRSKFIYVFIYSLYVYTLDWACMCGNGELCGHACYVYANKCASCTSIMGFSF